MKRLIPFEAGPSDAAELLFQFPAGEFEADGAAMGTIADVVVLQHAFRQLPQLLRAGLLSPALTAARQAEEW